MAIGGTAVGLAGWFLGWYGYERFEDTSGLKKNMEVNSVLSSTYGEFGRSDRLIADRIELESRLRDEIGRSNEKYTIVLGPRGCGKSTAVARACKGKKGIIRLSVGTVDKDILELICDELGIENRTEKRVFQLFKEAIKKQGIEDWRPTLVVEIDQRTKLAWLKKHRKH